jgi:hypothetical protein
LLGVTDRFKSTDEKEVNAQSRTKP